MRKISVLTPTYNEEDNIKELYQRIKKELEKLNYQYEIIVIDNNSNDDTVKILRGLCKLDKILK